MTTTRYKPLLRRNIFRLYKYHRFFVMALLVFCFTNCKKSLEKETHVSSAEANELTAAASTKPNVIFILADDIGYEIPGYTGGQSYSTPNIDQLAQNGLQFSQCNTAPDCSPSRIMLMTGKYNFRNYIEWGILDTSQYTIANIFHNAGYKTCVAGKWQFDGGDASIKKFGFDTYSVFLPFFTVNEAAENAFRYKNPHIYQNAAYLPDSATKGKYADDMFVDFISKFIDNNATKPFFIYYPVSLCHAPFCPTPDDPEFATWDPSLHQSNKQFFPSMVKYMDKEVGKIISKINSKGLTNKTIIVFAGDNGTPDQITSVFRGETVQGGKGTTTQWGTHVPLIFSLPGSIVPGIADSLIDLTDFLPTFADIARTTIPPYFGTIDGVSFYPALKGRNTDNFRQDIFCHWQAKSISSTKRWVNDRNYKLYDSINGSRFYNILKDTMEVLPITNRTITPQEKIIRDQMQQVLNQMHN